MKSVWIYADTAGSSTMRPLPLPFLEAKEPIDPELFRRQARGEDPRRPRLLGATDLCSMHVSRGRADPFRPAEGRHLVFVVSGEVELGVSDGGTDLLRPGDVFFEDDRVGHGHRVRWSDDCRVLRLGVADSWQPSGVTPDASEVGPVRGSASPLLRRIYKGADEKSYFARFDNLFPDDSGTWSTARPVTGFRFVHFPPDYFIDWHPEVVNNFVVVMTGRLELETGGDCRVEVFEPGDVCLAEDRTGVGHVDRIHGHTRVALIVLEDEHLWPRQR